MDFKELIERPIINNIYSSEWMNKMTYDEINSYFSMAQLLDPVDRITKEIDNNILYNLLKLCLEKVKMVCINQEGHDYDIGFELHKEYKVHMCKNKLYFYIRNNAKIMHQIDNDGKYLITLSEFREKRIDKILNGI